MPEPTYRLEDLPEQLSSKIRVDLFTGCWLWVRFCHRNGYGRVYWQGRTGSVHTVVYRLLVGPVPKGLELDHVRKRGCIWRNCCYPAHLEPVTHRENLRRRTGLCESGVTLAARSEAQTHCSKGHEYTPDNLVKRGNGKRECARCNADRVTAIYRRDMQDPEKAAVIRAKAAERMRRHRERKGDPTGAIEMRRYRERKKPALIRPRLPSAREDQ